MFDNTPSLFEASQPVDVQLLRAGNFLLVNPPQPWLAEELQMWEKFFPRGRALVEWMEEQKIELARLQSRKRPMPFKLTLKHLYTEGVYGGGQVGLCPIGLTQRVCELLRKRMLKYAFLDVFKRPSLPAPDYSKIETPRGNQLEALAAVVANDYTILDEPTGWGKGWLITQICRIWPDATILICVPQSRGLSIAETLSRYLEEHGIKAAVATKGRKNVGRVTICNPHAISRFSNSFLDSVQIFLYDEVYTAASPKTGIELSKIRNARMIGLADGPFARSDGRNLVTESFFGQIGHQTTYKKAVELGMVSPIEVLRVTVSPQAAVELRPRFGDSRKKKASYWQNDWRNSAIAQSIQTGCNHLGKAVEDTQILIMVETLEHALRIHRYLPDFTVCFSANVAKSRAGALEKKGLSKDAMSLTKKQLEKNRLAFEAGTLKHVITTPIWSAGVNFMHLELEVRADGCTSEIVGRQWAGRLSRLGIPKLLISYNDAHVNEWAGRRSDSQFKFFAGRGWKIVDSPYVLPIYAT